MDNVVKIKCPVCSTVLTVADNPANAGKHVTCPTCRKRNKFTDFVKVIPLKISGVTVFPGGNTNTVVGELYIPSRDITIPLKEGKNVIGRKAMTSKATIQLDNVSDRMSREHIEIVVTRDEGIVKHTISLAKKDVNPTYLQGNRILYKDKLILSDGDKIKLPELEICFRIKSLDMDATRMG